MTILKMINSGVRDMRGLELIMKGGPGSGPRKGGASKAQHKDDAKAAMEASAKAFASGSASDHQSAKDLHDKAAQSKAESGSKGIKSYGENVDHAAMSASHSKLAAPTDTSKSAAVKGELSGFKSAAIEGGGTKYTKDFAGTPRGAEAHYGKIKDALSKAGYSQLHSQAQGYDNNGQLHIDKTFVSNAPSGHSGGDRYVTVRVKDNKSSVSIYDK